jgi:AcrR family transcriptional regulator
MTDTTLTTDQKPAKRKNTREKLLKAALSLIAEDRGGLAGLSLREITRRIGVSPTAFYRHFPGMEELGLTLVRESCETLRKHLSETSPDGELHAQVHSTVQVFLAFVVEQRDIFVMIAREQAGGSKKMRAAISNEIELTTQQLVESWLARGLPSMPMEQLQRVVGMSISLAFSTLPAVLDMPEDADKEMASLANELEQQLDLLVLGAAALASQ